MRKYLHLTLLSLALFFVSNVCLAQSITPSTATLSAISTTYGTVSSEVSFTFTATGLVANEQVNITAPAGFEVSLTTNAGFADFVSVNANGGGNVSSTSIFVRLKATAIPATYSGNVTIAGTITIIAANVATTSSTVNKKNITITGATASNKQYDRTTTATLGGAPLLSGVLPADVANVTLNTGAATGAFDNRNVGTGKTVTASGFAITGTASSYYTLTQPTATADIIAKNLTITGVSVNNKPFDNNTTATVSGTATLNGIINPDVVTTTGSIPSGVFANIGPGIGISVTVSGYTLAGADALNYTVAQPAGLTASITSALPTTQPSGMTFSNITNTSLTVNYSAAGNGSARILIAKSGSAVSVNPVNGTTYTANGNFSTGTDLGSGNIVVGVVTSTTAGSFGVTNLTPNTTYHFALYEFNGSAGLESYNTTTPLIGSQSVRNEPANHVTGFSSSATATAITLSWTGSTGIPAPTNYLVLARDVTNGGTYVVFSDGNAAPPNDVNLSSQTSTWQGVQNVNFGTNTFNSWTNLTSGNQYEFVIHPYTTGGSLTPDFKTDGTIPTTTVFTEPSASAANPSFSNIAPTSIDVTVGGGTGVSGGYLVIRKSGSAPTATPVDRTAYTAGSTIAAGETVVYTGAAGLFTDSGLSPFTTYHYVVYGYSGSGTNTNYRITSPGAANSTTPCSPPTAQASGVNFTGVVEDQMTVNWTRGNGNNVIVFARDGATATANPVNGTTYTADPIFGGGTAIAISGNDYFAVYSGTGTSVTVTGLSSNRSYNFHVFEYTTIGLCYLTSIAPADASQATTLSGVNGSITTVSAAATISSIANTSGTKVAAFTFNVTDDNADSSPTRISSLIFRPGVGNTITNFSDLLLGADLTDQHGNTQTANITIGANTITITGIPNSGQGTTTTNTLGRTNDGENKNYTLNVWLRTTLGGTISSATVDGQKLVFSLAANDITYNTTGVSSSSILAGSSCEAGSVNGVIAVVATKININQQPSASAVATVALSTQPIFEATDVNNNRDLNINNAITVLTTNPNNLGSASVPSFSNGLADFTGSGFNFPNAGTSTMAARITTPTITSPNSNSITVTASTTLGASTATLAASPLLNGSTGNAVLGFSLQTTGSTLNLTNLTFTSNVSATGLVKNFKLFSNSSDSFSGATEVATSTTQTFSGLTIPVNGTIKYFYLVVDVEPDFPTANPQIEFSLTTANLTVSTGNKVGPTQTGPLYDLEDQTPPTVISIDISSPTESWSTVNGSSANTLTWLVTFSESVTGVDAFDFNLINPSVTGISYTLPLVVTGSGKTRTITLNNVQLLSQGTDRQLYINLVDNNTIIDNAGFALGGLLGDGSLTSTIAFPGSSAPGFNDYFTVLFKEPSNAASNLTISKTTTSLTVGWTNPFLPVNPTSFYFIQVKKSTTPGFPDLNDGTYLTNLDSDATDGSYSTLISGSATSTIINSLPSGLDYDVRLTSLSYSGFVNNQYQMDYLNSSTLNGSDFTTTAANGTLSGSGSTTISSIIDTPAESETVFTFNVIDDGAAIASDNAPLKFSQLVVTPGTGNTVANWTTAIAGAELTNGTTTIAGTVNAGNITFSSLNSVPTQASDLGYVADNQNKPYQLKIWLNTTVTDNSKLAFRVNNASFTYNNALDATNFSKVSSQLAAGQIAESGAVNINVAATKLAFTTQPPAAIGVATPFSSMGTPPVVKATDANNNLDTDYTATFNVTPSTGVSTSITNFTAGTLTLSSFYFSTAGSRTITITGNSTGAPFNYPALSGPGVEALSTSVNAVISNKTTITEATAPASELASFSSITNALPASYNFDFTVTDDVGANSTTYADNDGLPTLIQTLTIAQGANNGTNQSPGPNNDASTFDDWTKSIAGAQLTDGVSTITIVSGANITGSSLIFSIPAGSSLRTIADGAAKTYQLRIWLKNTVDVTLQDILDNKDFSFAINQSNIDLDPTANVSSTLASSNASTGDGRNVVTVTATQLDFIAQWAANAAQSYDAPFSPTPTAKARDANSNLDSDFNAAVSVSAFDVDGVGPKTYPLTNSTVTVNNGNISFNANLQVSSSGNGSGNDVSRLILSSTGLNNGNSNNFVLGYSALSNIIKDTNFKSTSTYASGNGYPENILYSTFQASTFATNTDGIALERFILQDGGGSNDADGTPTKLQSLTLNISNYQYLRTVAVYDGNTKIAERVVSGNMTNTSGITGDLVFPSLLSPLAAADNGNNDFTVFATFNQTGIIDNEVIQVRVNGATTAAVSSSFITGGTVTTFAPLNASENENKIEVVATKIDFTTFPVSASASISVPFPVQVSARDVNNNLDADYNGTITATSNTIPGSFTTANDPTGAFTAGIKDYPANFQFTAGNGNVQLTITSGAGSGAGSINAGIISGTSPVIEVISAFDSWLYFDPSFTYTPRIDFANKQEDPIVSTSQPLARLILSDGGSAFSAASTDNPSPGIKNQTTHKDVDGAFTKIDNFTISLTNFQNIRKIALYASDGVTKIGSDQTPAASVTFSGLSSFFAPDDGTYQFYIRASFNTTVTDLTQIGMQITAVTHNSGSKFAEQKPTLPPPAIAGVDGAAAFGDSSPLTVGAVQVNVLDVITTKFDFMQSPPRYAGINEPVPLAGTPVIEVRARDKFDNLDTEFNFQTSSALYSVSITAATAGVNPGTGTFVNGVLLLPTLQYSSPGNGKLTVTSTSNTSITSNVVGAVQCTAVDVIHVTAVENRSNGVSLVESLKGGTTNNRIFGFTFQAPHVDAPNGEPLLEGFSITFKNDDGNPYPYSSTGTTIFKNFKIFKSINGAAPTPTTSELTITEVASEQLLSNNPTTTSKDMVRVTFNNTAYPTLFDGRTYTFYLTVDVDVSVSVGTPAITPYLQDQGNGFPLTNDHILISNGSTLANVQGITRRFASTKPPLLVRTIPENGTLNVRKDLEYVDLFFDVPVVTFDGKAFLYKRNDPTTVVAELTAANGLFVDSETLTAAEAIKTQVVPYLRFLLPLDLPDLDADEVYFITLPKGRFSNIDRNDRAGISDEGLNLYGGISFNGTFYFKVGSDFAPKLLTSNRDKYFYTPTTATFNTSFDQGGKAYYMVVESTGGTPPTVTNNQILGTDTYSATAVITRGSYVISQVSPNYQYATINANLTAGANYWVYLFAENDRVPNPVRNNAPYGGFIDDGATQNPNNDYVVGGNGPTLILNKPTSPPITRYSNPSFTICTNSSIKLQEPIIISESAPGEFQGAGVQTFNLLLPSGFQFDITREPVFTGNGSDFDPLPSGAKRFNYINTTFLEISFVNNRAISTDNIIISDIYVIASGPDLSGKIKRFAGTGLSIVPTPTDLATISSIPASAITFTNTYSEANRFDLAPLFIENTVTYIPDNYVDANGTSTIRLIPKIEPGVRDFGSSSFSGSGLTDDILTLSAVSLNTAFNITITHTDQNGCVSNSSEQYAVYDHTAAIPELLPDPDNDKDIRIAIENVNFPNNPPSLKDPTQVVRYEGLAGYQLLDLYTKVPTRATAITDPTNFAANALTDQIIHGGNWNSMIKHIPVPIASILSDNLSSPGNDVFYKSYNWDYTSILHNDSLAKYSISNPYITYFERRTLDRTATSGAIIPGQKYYTGGSLGLVEFTGKYQSTADFSVFVPFRQEVELFVPAIPVIEVSGESSFQGITPVFCATTSGNILISGYPAASSTSKGVFALYDSASYNPNTPNDLTAIIYKTGTAKVPAGFVDNANGTANLNVGLIANGYRTIRIEYTYQDNNSPAVGKGVTYLRVTPNPVANFSTSNLCEDIKINFTDESTSATASGVRIAKWDWNFNDINASGTNQNRDVLQNPIHEYSEPLDYPNVGLIVTTNFGCASPVYQQTLSIGGTPEVNFDFIGVSTADAIDFVSSSVVVNDVINSQAWIYGDGKNGSGSSVSNTYGATGTYVAKLTVTSQKGCVNSRSKNVIILPRVTISNANVYSKNFEADNAEWLYYPTTATWQWTTASKSVIKNNPTLNGQKVWITNNAGAYDKESYLYTASYDISALDRPMISFNSFVQMDNGDGVVIEYSTDIKNATDSSKVWIRLGSNITGIDWYNGQGLPSNPGKQVGGDFGWTGTKDAAGNSTGWKESKHSLSDVPAAAKGKVVFRFAIASAAGADREPVSDGFALDNVRIGNRTRTILIENFTNKGGSRPVEKQVSDYLKDFIGSVGTEIVKINYHVGFPGPAADPFNASNPADPSARALFYNVVNTPTTFMDALTDKVNPLFPQWAQSKYDSQSLNLAAAEIVIAPPTISATTGTYTLAVNVKANKQLPANTVLHVAFLEQEISLANDLPTKENKFEYVLKKLLPSGAGTKFNTVLNEGDTRPFTTGLEWTPDTKNLYAPSNDLVVIAFLQNETTKEIYQSSSVSGISDPPVVTGIGDILPHEVNVYPNPASREFRVELPAFVQTEAIIHLIDLTGRKYDVGKIEAGSNAASVNVENLSEGIYILEIGSDKTGIIRKKIMVVMNK